MKCPLFGDHLILVLHHLFRATAGAYRIRTLWGSAGLPKKEPWIK